MHLKIVTAGLFLSLLNSAPAAARTFSTQDVLSDRASNYEKMIDLEEWAASLRKSAHRLAPVAVYLSAHCKQHFGFASSTALPSAPLPQGYSAGKPSTRELQQICPVFLESRFETLRCSFSPTQSDNTVFGQNRASSGSWRIRKNTVIKNKVPLRANYDCQFNRQGKALSPFTFTVNIQSVIHFSENKELLQASDAVRAATVETFSKRDQQELNAPKTALGVLLFD